MSSLLALAAALVLASSAGAESMREWFNRGKAARDPGLALDYYDKALAAWSGSDGADNKASILVNRCGVYMDLGRYAQAIRDCDEAAGLNPNDPSPYVNRGLVYFKQGRPADALADLTRAVELNPDSAMAHMNRGVVRRDLGQADLAMEDQQKALALDPRLAQAYAGRAQLYVDRGEVEKGVADYDKALELDPNDAGAWGNRGLARQQQKRWGEALADAQTSVKLSPKDPQLFLNLSTAYLGVDDSTSAVAAVTKALALGRQDAKTYWARGFTRLLAHQNKLALEDFERAVALEPGKEDYRERRAAALFRLGRLDEALERCAEDRKALPDSRTPLEECAQAHLLQGKTTEALAELDEALKLSDTKSAFTPFLRGWTLFEQGKLDEAEAAFKALPAGLDVDDGAAFGLAAVAMRRGRLGEGKAAWDKAVGFEPRIAKGLDALEVAGYDFLSTKDKQLYLSMRKTWGTKP